MSFMDDSASTPIMEKITISEEVMNLGTAGVECLVVDDSDRVSVRSADNASMLTEEREAEIACEEYDRKQAEEEALLCENVKKFCKELWPAPMDLCHRFMRCARQTRNGRVLMPAI